MALVGSMPGPRISSSKARTDENPGSQLTLPRGVDYLGKPKGHTVTYLSDTAGLSVITCCIGKEIIRHLGSNGKGGGGDEETTSP